MKLDRRSFLRAVGAAGAGAALAAPSAAAVRGEPGPAPAVFPEGIASGDPRPDGSLLWTRVSPPPDLSALDVFWEVATDDVFAQIVANGVEAATAERDHTVHVAVDGLHADRWYHYRFTAGGVQSAVGRMRTTPAPGSTPDRLRFAFASCQQINESHYVAHRAIAEEGVDFLMHLGDYVYVDDRRTLTLDDYRAVYRRFKANPLLQDCHARVPCVYMWDDGEFWNGVDARTDPWQDALDHAERWQNAADAAFEYLPLQRWPDDPNRVYRALRWGTLADLFVLDDRSYRDPAVDELNSLSTAGAFMMDPQRTTLGAAQKQWVKDGLESSTAAWRVLANGYNMLPWRLVDLDHPWMRRLNPRWQRNAGVYAPNEAWDDYQADRRELLQHIADSGVRNVVSCAGHTHMFFAGNLIPDFDDPASPVAAAEFVTGSLTSDPDPRTYFGSLPRGLAEELLHFAERYCLAANPYWRHANFIDQGYAVVEVTPEELICEFRLIDTFDPDAFARTGARFRVVAGRPGIETLSPG